MPDVQGNRRSLIRRPVALDVLAIRDFRWFAVSAAFSDLGISLRLVVTAWVVLELTDSAAWVGLVVGIRALPTVLLTLYGGVVADRVSKRRILMATRIGLAGLAFLAGILISTGAIEAWHLLVISIGVAFWGAGKIFRVGILMTGKPPRPLEIIRIVLSKTA